VPQRGQYDDVQKSRGCPHRQVSPDAAAPGCCSAARRSSRICMVPPTRYTLPSPSAFIGGPWKNTRE